VAAGGDCHSRGGIDLDADTLVAGEEVCMLLVFETSGWTLASTSTWTVWIAWE
jgi:hypothetical protein